MADMDDEIDPLNPNPKTLTLKFHYEQSGTKSSLQNMLVETPASENQQTSYDSNKSFNFSSKKQSLSTDEKSSPRGFLSQRVARAGVSPPITAEINSANIASTMNIQSSYLTSSYERSPSAFLEPPELIPNSLGQSSPTTGKFSLLRNNGYSVPMSTSDSIIIDNSKALKEIMSGGFSSQLSLDRTPSYCSGLETKISSPIENNKENIQNEFKEPSDSEYPDDDICENSSPRETEFNAEDDGYNWRKYGQKQVKGIKYPRSYYKCSHPHCEARKIVERSPAGYITEIIYRKKHDHEMPVRRRRSWNPPFHRYYNDTDTSTLHGESSSSTNADELEGGEETHASIKNEADGQEDDQRNFDVCEVVMKVGSRGVRLPRVVVQTRSDIDILEDGYRWRKYGQKMVKGNTNARNYYKCATAGCTVRKQVERAMGDRGSVITTYEGKHNHKVPAAKISINHDASNGSQTLNRWHPHLPPLPLASLGYPPFLNGFDLPDFSYGVGPLGLGGSGISFIEQMGGQFGVPFLDSDYHFDGVGADEVTPPDEDAYE